MDELLRQLCLAAATSGNEHDVRDIIRLQLENLGEIAATNWTDLACERTGNTGNRPLVAVCCHMDSPGFVVKEILDDGRLSLVSLGGIDPAVAFLAPVKLKSSRRSYSGVITVEGEAKGKHSEFRGYFGFESKSVAIQVGIKKGDIVTWNFQPFELENDLYCAPHLDNRLGCYLMVKTAQLLASQELDCDVVYLATSCEETSLHRGASIFSEKYRPDLAIVFDTTYQENDVKMGNGPVMTLTDDSIYLPMPVRDEIIELAQQNQLRLQLEVYNYAGTDAAEFSRRGPAGCLTIPLLIATMHNHSGLEIMSLKDIAPTIELTCQIIGHSSKLRKKI